MTSKQIKDPIFTEEFWKRPDPCDKGNSDVNMIYRAVGYTTSKWESLEQSMAHLFLGIASTSGPSYKTISRAYGSIFGNAGRRQALQYAAEAHFDNFWQYAAVREPCQNIINAIGYASARRDDVVHGIAHDNITLIVDGEKVKESGAVLMPPEYNTKFTLPQHREDPLVVFTTARYRYCAEQITQFGNDFGRLSKIVLAFWPTIIRQPDGQIPLIRDLLAAGKIP